MNLKLPADFSPEERRDRAESYFNQGYNCCQSILLAFADILEDNCLATRDMLIAAGSGFGGGMGRMREVCGAFSGLVAISGFISPAMNPKNMEERTGNYTLVQDFAGQFKEANGGSIICRELLGLARKPSSQESPVPSERTESYYKKRPCPKIVGSAAYIAALKLSGK
ncbi:MAG: C-GCAxxG-C-C family protein [Candidatus Cryptobacteroides sp.]|nr:C-GCAxxG-C-C family protein [Bacteroidales bacterium]